MEMRWPDSSYRATHSPLPEFWEFSRQVLSHLSRERNDLVVLVDPQRIAFGVEGLKVSKVEGQTPHAFAMQHKVGRSKKEPPGPAERLL
jgi:hypothetical protein